MLYGQSPLQLNDNIEKKRKGKHWLGAIKTKSLTKSSGFLFCHHAKH